jgi:hypothetical protein
MRFERAGLFEAIRRIYGCDEVLYPGSNIHVTPSLFFPHVVYVDQHPTAKEFFADMQSVLAYVGRNKNYDRSPYLLFLPLDYTGALPLREETFDLLISLFAGNIARTCGKYLRSGGILITNNHHGDASAASLDDELALIAVVHYHGGDYSIAYSIAEEKASLELPAKTRQVKNRDYLRRTSDGIEYRENELYFVFRKRSTRRMAGIMP